MIQIFALCTHFLCCVTNYHELSCLNHPSYVSSQSCRKKTGWRGPHGLIQLPCLATCPAKVGVSARLASYLEALGRTHIQVRSGLWQNPLPCGLGPEVPFLLVRQGPLCFLEATSFLLCGPCILRVCTSLSILRASHLCPLP